jgi:hypothetical protein
VFWKEGVMMTAEFSEKRRFKRIPLQLDINGALPKGFLQNHKFEGKTQDISFDGLRIKIDHPNGFEVGQMIKFKTKLYVGDFTNKGKGLIAWVNGPEIHQSTDMIGLKLIKVGHYRLWCERIERMMKTLASKPNPQYS